MFSVSVLLTRAFALCLFLFLLMMPSVSIQAVKEGVLLWYRSVLPVLFPFLLISSLFIRLRFTDMIPEKITRPVSRLFHCSGNGALAVILGFLCGYPMGCKIASDLESEHLISAEEARHLRTFVNNVSPGFLISYVCLTCLKDPSRIPFVLTVVLGASFLYGILTRPENAYPEYRPHNIPAKISVNHAIDESICDSIRNILRLSGYITLFSLIGAVLSVLLPPVPALQLLTSAILEMTGGISRICSAGLPQNICLFLICCTCAFGGLSSFVQTISLSGMDRFSALQYIKSRVKITLLTIILYLALTGISCLMHLTPAR